MTFLSHAEATKKVLIHGGDSTLLATREAILAMHGLNVEVALGVVDLPATIAEQRPNLLVICSSLPVDAQRRDLQVARSVDYGLKCLLIRSGSTLRIEPAEGHGAMEWFDGPENFVNCVKQLI